MTNLSETLRTKRNQIWSGFAAASRNFSESAEDICKNWSVAADQLLTEAFQEFFPSENFALFALGKLGSYELNLSSDVDILILSNGKDENWLPALRKFQNALTERTAQGFVFRVDFDLRPGGRQGPLVPTLEQFKDYYGNYGETWERLALVRLRGICGDPKVQEEALSFAKRFSFRKHLDFTLFEDLKTLRQKIQSHYWERAQQGSVDLKLGIGGIRDVELFVHALQVVHGGKDTSLQVSSTPLALKILKEKNLLPAEEADFLSRHYWDMRALENYVQALNDEQTHILDLSLSLPTPGQALVQGLTADMHRCQEIVKSLLGEPPQETFLEKDLKKFGIQDQILEEIWSEILKDEVLSRNKARDEAARKSFLNEFIQALFEQGGDLNRGLLLLKDFIKSTKAKATFFSLLLREKTLLKKISWLFGHSPYLSRILCNRPELLDSFIYRSQDKLPEDMGLLLEELAERKLLSELINGSDFFQSRNAVTLQEHLTFTADSICIDLISALKKEFPSPMQVLALGKWGGKELGFRSDLDFIFVTPDEPNDTDYRLAKRIVSRLTEAHRGGSIYSVDMRLRPSGKAGPLVISIGDLKNYLLTESAAWERQAYLKARWLNSEWESPASWFIHRELPKTDVIELERIRNELLYRGPALDLKYSEGGLIDIEFSAQIYLLKHQELPKNTSTLHFLERISTAGADTLTENYKQLRQYEQMLHLVASENQVEVSENHQSFQFLALALHEDPQSLYQHIQNLLQANIGILKTLDPRRTSH